MNYNDYLISYLLSKVKKIKFFKKIFIFILLTNMLII